MPLYEVERPERHRNDIGLNHRNGIGQRNGIGRDSLVMDSRLISLSEPLKISGETPLSP